MQVMVLGPLQVVRSHRIATPSAPKLRKALSLLTLYANTVVRTDQIIEELWDDDPPVSVATTLQTYVYQLRKLLLLGVPHDLAGPPRPRADGVCLQTSANGYLLSLPPDAVDATRFTSLAAQGRALLEAGQVVTAADTLADALRLWRGPALVDVTHGPLLQAEVLRLEETRKSAVEARLDADLMLGRHHQVLGELTALVAKQNTHEGFSAKLMLALYRAGRRSEALGVYQNLRTALARDLGLDPSADTERLHRAMLEGDLKLDRPQGRRAATGSQVTREPPCQIPPKGPALVGRDRELAAVANALSRGPRRTAPAVVAVGGPPGCGATALVVHAADRARADYPDGQLYARLLNQQGLRVDTGEVLGGFLRALDVPQQRIPDAADERCQLFRTLTSERRILVILDDVVDREQLSALMPSSVDSAMLVTSRRLLCTPAVTRTVPLAPLDMDSSLQLLAAVLGRPRLEREPLVSRELVYLCDGLPSALHAAASVLVARSHWSVTRLIAWKRREMDRPAGDPLQLRSSVERTYRLAAQPVQAALGRLAELSAEHGVSVAMAAALLGMDEHAAESVLEELVELYLIGADTGSATACNYRFLPALRSIGHQLATGL